MNGARLSFLMLVVLACDGFPFGGDEPRPGDSDSAVEAEACTDDAQCDVGSICEDEACEVAVCADLYDPECGVDGTTYGNACEARAAHVTVAHAGECPTVCGGIQGTPCGEGETCDLPQGMCTTSALEGVCVETPTSCPEVYDPVCGCDNQTYSNDCFRLMAGAQPNHDGECAVER